jgi:ribosomal protein S18 acetylase RimI-like enzyme
MDSTPLTLRQYQATDETAVVALWHACELTRPWNDPRQDIARKRTVQPEGFMLGCVAGQVVASAMFGYDGHRGWVNYLAVAPLHQGRGHARALMTAGEQWLTSAGCPKLNLQIRSSNAAVIAFYQRLGYAADEVVSMGKRLISDT